MVISIFYDFGTDRKPRISAFDRFKNRRKWISPSKIIAISSLRPEIQNIQRNSEFHNFPQFYPCTLVYACTLIKNSNTFVSAYANLVSKNAYAKFCRYHCFSPVELFIFPTEFLNFLYFSLSLQDFFDFVDF